MSYIKKKQWLDSLISSQEDQEIKGNLTETGISYLNGLKTARKMIFGHPVKLIFKSETSKAIYSWDGEYVSVVVASEKRPLGKIMKGFSKDDLDKAYKSKLNIFKIGDATYSIINRI